MERAFMATRKFPLFLKLLGGVCLTSFLASCGGGYPQTLKTPFSQGTEGLNTPASEFHPETSNRYVAFVSDRNGSQDIYLYDQRDRAFSWRNSMMKNFQTAKNEAKKRNQLLSR